MKTNYDPAFEIAFSSASASGLKMIVQNITRATPPQGWETALPRTDQI
ncbi:MAG: hypothetical protein ACREIC_15375 [Limisphaerales bacterium]